MDKINVVIVDPETGEINRIPKFRERAKPRAVIEFVDPKTGATNMVRQFGKNQRTTVTIRYVW